MQVAYAPSPIIFAVYISPHVSKVELGPGHPIHSAKLACEK